MMDKGLDTRFLFPDGNSISLKEQLRVKTLGFTPSAPKVERQKEKIPGSYGIRTTSSTYTEFPVSLRIWIECKDTQGVQEKLLELRGFFARLQDYYLVYSDMPGIRWPVQYEDMQENRKAGQVKFECIVNFNVPTGYAESLFTTDNTKEWDKGLLQWGMGIKWDEDMSYVYDERKFDVLNIGTIDINPAQHEIKWLIKANLSRIKIKNVTTGDQLIYYNAGRDEPGVFVLDGIHITDQNGISLVRFADEGEIWLATGKNRIEIDALEYEWCKIITRFYYA
ncbi:phage tail domain-containing protein [Bacillus sp. NPDC077411]|uniref:phage tail domain-containing protein n=1 Tax=Bacillus sp. NPDC077411 TaxID=3363947 RepID=UPI0037CB1500